MGPGAQDLVYDENENLADPIIVRSDGRAVYNFASPVDDMLDGITHVIRGEDHVSNTPTQIHLLRALGDYMQNRHGMQVTWTSDDTLHLKGKYTVVEIDAQVRLEPGRVRRGRHPGEAHREDVGAALAGVAARSIVVAAAELLGDLVELLQPHLALLDLLHERCVLGRRVRHPPDARSEHEA